LANNATYLFFGALIKQGVIFYHIYFFTISTGKHMQTTTNNHKQSQTVTHNRTDYLNYCSCQARVIPCVRFFEGFQSSLQQ
jgi:hypothetical protein